MDNVNTILKQTYGDHGIRFAAPDLLDYAMIFEINSGEYEGERLWIDSSYHICCGTLEVDAGLITTYIRWHNKMDGCVPEPEPTVIVEEREVTLEPTLSSTEKILVAQTGQASYKATRQAGTTPDTRSDFEKCVEDNNYVRYVVTGEGVSGVSITLANDMGGTEQGDYKLPFCLPFDGFVSGDFLYIFAQIISPTNGAGKITCKIYVGNTVVSMANASRFASIATCSETK